MRAPQLSVRLINERMYVCWPSAECNGDFYSLLLVYHLPPRMLDEHGTFGRAKGRERPNVFTC